MSTQKPKTRMGRPPKDPLEKQDWALSVRFTKKQYVHLVRLAREAGISMSQYIVRRLDL